VVRAILESDALILRGELRLRIPRADLKNWQVDGDDLRLRTSMGPVLLTIGASEAARWVAALNRPMPTLGDKLGLANARLWVLTPVDDADLSAALTEAVETNGADATLGLAVLRGPGDLDRLITVCAAHPDLPIWAINEKGKQAGVPESAIRIALRGMGWVDTKACAVSASLTGTRYQRRRG
jgi:hypothetical protein